jgi:hypothetical protein
MPAAGRASCGPRSGWPGRADAGEAEVTFRDYLVRRMQQPRFANARSVRSELERAWLRHAHRLADEPHLARTRDDLMRIEPPDILASAVYSLLAGEQLY